MRITLLGTGGPELSVDRMGSATLIEAGEEILLFDAGRGVMQRLFECGVRINSVTNVIFTHLHSDHIEGLPELWFAPWFLLGRKTRMAFWGPPKTASMLAGMRSFLQHDIEAREEDGCPASDLDFSVTEFHEPGLIYAARGISVTAVAVDHKDGNPAFGFIIEYGGRRVILSGDCTYSADLAAAGPADVVVYNVFAPSMELLQRDPFKRRVAEKLASPEQAGRVFKETQAALGLFSHVIPMGSTNESIIARARSSGYDGRIVVGADRMRVVVGAVPEVIEPASLDNVRPVAARGDG